MIAWFHHFFAALRGPLPSCKPMGGEKLAVGGVCLRNDLLCQIQNLSFSYQTEPAGQLKVRATDDVEKVVSSRKGFCNGGAGDPARHGHHLVHIDVPRAWRAMPSGRWRL